MNLKVFLRQLRFWTLHCTINALPSFAIAAFLLEMRKSPSALLAMLAAVVTFILLYSILTSITSPLTNESHLLARSLRLGTKIRAWISGLSLLLIVTVKPLFFIPDFWCGFLSVALLDRVVKIFHPGSLTFAFVDSSIATRPDNFLPVFATTLLEGFILSLILLIISFFAILFLQAKDRRRAFRNPDPRRVNGI